MLKSEQRHDAPMSAQVGFWNTWNADARESGVGQVSVEQAVVVSQWLQRLGRTDFNIIEIGCGAGWFCAQLDRFGSVTGVDLADEVLERAAKRVPSATFVAGDFMNLDVGKEAYDVAVSLEVIAHVADQRAFLAKIADALRPGGYLALATQNRPALERNDVPPPGPGQIRHWIDRKELSVLLQERFEVLEMFSITPQFNRGYLKYANSQRIQKLLSTVGLGSVNHYFKRFQEKRWLGWSIMALCARRSRDRDAVFRGVTRSG